MSDTLVFLGPSLAHADARRLLPDAELAPPAQVGDIYRAVRSRRRPSRIALVDGVFEGLAAPWHKELLYALERGVTLYGAASMGALRAAELAPFGMVPVGGIARDFMDGTLTDDDEVAVAHLPAAQGFRPVSIAMVNLREGLARAAEARVITAATRDRLIAQAKATFYRERDWALVCARQPRLTAFIERTRPDRKAADTRLLLRRLARRVDPPPTGVSVNRTWFWRRFCELEG
jgi:hypothetical protein